ncbi:YggT family protein [Candidatus Gottesmanbacteria bacterium]|nr:YggT family protein [Candidatus Gottesmanbacteria bacterium]
MQQEETEIQEVKTTRKITPPGETEPPQKVYQKKKAIFRTYQVIWYVLGMIEVLLIFRITLKALGANPSSGFANLIYALSDPLASPFSGIFRITVSEGAVFEWSTVIAGFVYALIAFGITELLQLVKPTTPEEVEQNVDNQ